MNFDKIVNVGLTIQNPHGSETWFVPVEEVVIDDLPFVVEVMYEDLSIAVLSDEQKLILGDFLEEAIEGREYSEVCYTGWCWTGRRREWWEQVARCARPDWASWVGRGGELGVDDIPF